MNAMLDPDQPDEIRTFVGSIVFIDIVDYSRKTVAEQILIRERFKSLMMASLEGIDRDLRLVLDTGDGAAISFLGDLKDALTVSVRIRDYLHLANGAPLPEAAAANLNRTTPIFNYALRIGINFGPVKLQQDNHGHPQIVGDGINVAQRITGFAKTGQIVVSQSYFDAVSTAAPHYAGLLSYEGSRTDKNVREHEIYVVGDSAALTITAGIAGTSGVEQKAASRATDARNGNGKDISSAAPGGKATASVVGSTGEKHARNIGASTLPMPFMQDRNKLLLTGSILAFVVAGLFAITMVRKSTTKALQKYENVPEEVSNNLPKASASAPAPAITAESPVVSTSSATISPTESVSAPPANAALAPSAAGLPATIIPAVDPTRNAVKPALKPPVAQGVISYGIQPWGDVYINGRSVGASPPLKQSKLAPGTYRVEIKNTTFPSYTTTVEVTSKETVSVKYRF